MLSFKEALEMLNEDEKPSILLANGFSQAWDAGKFNYANLLDASDFGDRDDIIRPLFTSLETFDFESVMKQLVAAEAVLTAYDADQRLLQDIASDKENLKDALITAISNTHPNLPNEIKDDQFIAVRNFLSQFNEVYSINYDLLLYWARNKSNLEPENYRTDDGFRAEYCWKGYDSNQEIYFLHGGLHIYDTGSDIKKHVYTDKGETIIDQVRTNLDAGRFPLFVSEPTYQKKKQRIDHNPYLKYCYQALGNVKDAIFIYGHSMDENDKHIFDKIKSSKASKIFVSIFGNEYSEQNTRSKANALAYLNRDGVEVKFYQAETTPVWKEG